MARASLHFSNRQVLAAALPGGGGRGVEPPLPVKARQPKVLILGGTGRVGGSTARALSKFCPSLRLLIAGRNRDKGASLVSTLGENSEFVEIDVGNVKTLEAALNGVDLVVHAAGPFQQEEKCNVLETAIATKDVVSPDLTYGIDNGAKSQEVEKKVLWSVRIASACREVGRLSPGILPGMTPFDGQGEALASCAMLLALNGGTEMSLGPRVGLAQGPITYVDVCDDTDYAWRAKTFHNKAVDAGVPAITTAGIYPGVSN
ncbi:hypothetical protein Taro_026068, partial [Colocasia esculenta]|nr:hypothetical protein [Colocasia esculenta]